MRFGPLEEDATLITRYLIKVPLVFYNTKDADKDKFAQLTFDKIEEHINQNIKFIKEALDLQELEISYKEFNDPDLSMILTIDINIDPDEILRVLGRYVKVDMKNENDQRIKTISQWAQCEKYFDTIDD